MGPPTLFPDAPFFKGSKITAALGVWISNPLDWAILYYLNYKLGALILGFSGNNEIFLSVAKAINGGEEGIGLIKKIMDAGGAIIAAFTLGGLIMGVAAAIPSYFIFLNIFHRAKAWRKEARTRNPSQKRNE